MRKSQREVRGEEDTGFNSVRVVNLSLFGNLIAFACVNHVVVEPLYNQLELIR